MSVKSGLGIVIHSGSYDRIYHGLSLALAALALGREVTIFFSYWALEYLKKKAPEDISLDKEAERHKEIIERNIERGHLGEFSELTSQAKKMGAKFYACTSSMGLLNIARDELVQEVDKSMGITTFLTETADFQLLFI